MVLDDELVQRFEEDQKSHGTKTALYNLIWKQATEMLRNIGVKRIKTSTLPPKPPDTSKFLRLGMEKASAVRGAHKSTRPERT